MDNLVSLRKRKIDFDESPLLCGQCHFQKQKDWVFGGHGRRAGPWEKPHEVPLNHENLRIADRSKIGTWKGERSVLACTACHNPHSPSIKSYAPSPPPKVRTGLARAKDGHEDNPPIWEQFARLAPTQPKPGPKGAKTNPPSHQGAQPGGKP